jgi:hypothetical protein
MKIDGPNPLRRNEGLRKKDAAAKAGASDFFSLLSADEAAGASDTAPPADIQPSPSLDALLTLQEMPDDEVRERKAFRQTQDTLDALERLRDALLGEKIPQQVLDDLQHLAQHAPVDPNDPRLKSILQDVELRAAVELAKIERAKED